MFGRGAPSNPAPQCDGRHKGVCAYCPQVAAAAYSEVNLRPGSKAAQIAAELTTAARRQRK